LNDNVAYIIRFTRNVRLRNSEQHVRAIIILCVTFSSCTNRRNVNTKRMNGQIEIAIFYGSSTLIICFGQLNLSDGPFLQVFNYRGLLAMLTSLRVSS